MGWTILLWHHLPRLGHSPASRAWWVGLDTVEAALFAGAAWTHWRTHPAERAVLAVGASALVLDAVVDVASSRQPRQRVRALALVPVELGFAAWLWRVRRGFDDHQG